MTGILRIGSMLLIIAGLLLLVDVGLTLVWQEPFSAVYAEVQQGRLSGQLKKLGNQHATVASTALKRPRNEQSRLALLAESLQKSVKDGDPLGRIKVPQIGANFVFVQGITTSALIKGPGHYAQTQLPGLPGTVAIAGHRTTYLAPFRKINQLQPGDDIVLEMPYGTFTYAVSKTRIVKPSAVNVLKNTGQNQVVLTACHPLYSAAQRIVVFGDLKQSVARNATVHATTNQSFTS